MKLGLESVVADALKELSHSHATYMATIRVGELDDPELEVERRAAYERHYAAKERVQKLADVLYPAPPAPPPKKRAKPRSSGLAMVRPANDAPGRPRPRALPPPQVEVTIIDEEKPKKASRQTLLLIPEARRG